MFLAGRTLETLDRVAGEIRTAGGQVDTAIVDALNEHRVDEHAAAVFDTGGSLDISLNVISDGDLQGVPMTEMTIEDYLRPIATAVTSKFFTSRAAARHMARQGSSVIMAFGGATDPAGIKG